MNKLIPLFFLLPVLALGAEGDVPIEQADGTFQSGTLTPANIGAATAAQGALAASATQPGNALTTLSSGAATADQVPIADGSGGIAWGAQSGGGSSIWWTDVPYSTDANWSPACNTQQLVDASTWTAPRTPTLPTCSYGDRVAFMVEDMSDAGAVVITGSINGGTGEWQRLIIAGERAVLINVGSGAWRVESSDLIASFAFLDTNGNSSYIAYTSGAWTEMPLSNVEGSLGVIVAVSDTLGVASTVQPRRAGQYQMYALSYANGTATGAVTSRTMIAIGSVATSTAYPGGFVYGVLPDAPAIQSQTSTPLVDWHYGDGYMRMRVRTTFSGGTMLTPGDNATRMIVREIL